MQTIVRWWRLPEHFDWVSSYLRARRMAAVTRVVVTVSTLLLATVPVAMLFSSAPPASTTGRVLSALATAGGLSAALLWAARFPTRRQSIAYALTCSASIAAAALAQNDPLSAILACSAFAAISGYIALFHSTALMTANLLIVAASLAMPAVAFAAASGAVRAVCAVVVVLVANATVPFGVQIIVQALGIDLLRADRDPLTGLYNRRAFHRRTVDLVRTQGEGTLLVAMIDLDGFKQINDVHGHGVGDVVLIAVGRALQAHTRREAIVGRVGGEEFVVADVVDDPRAEPIGPRLCAAVAALPYRITASVGTATIPCAEIHGAHDAARVITAAIDAADSAMYVAKRSGGNHARRHRPRPALDGARRGARSWNGIAKRWESGAQPPEGDDVTRPLDVPGAHRGGLERRHAPTRPEPPRLHHEQDPEHHRRLLDRPVDAPRPDTARHRPTATRPMASDGDHRSSWQTRDVS